MTSISNAILKINGLTKIFGVGCLFCSQSTGPEYETNLCHHCGSVVACSDVSFELYPDEIMGIVGESGSGKSTIVKLLHFDWEATSGEMYIQDTEHRTQNTEHRAQTGYRTQNTEHGCGKNKR